MAITVSGSIGTDHYQATLHTESHTLLADEPTHNGGQDKGPTPSQIVLSGLAACKLITTRMYADRKEWPVKSIQLQLEMEVDYKSRPAVTNIRCQLLAEGNLSPEQQSRLTSIADKCPVHRLLSGSVDIQTIWEDN